MLIQFLKLSYKLELRIAEELHVLACSCIDVLNLMGTVGERIGNSDEIHFGMFLYSSFLKQLANAQELRCSVSVPLCFYQLDGDLFVRLQRVSLAVRCQLRCNMSAQLPLVHFHVGSVQLVSLSGSSDVICSQLLLPPSLQLVISAAVCAAARIPDHQSLLNLMIQTL